MRELTVSRVLAAYARGAGITFLADGQAVPPLTVFSTRAFLPIVSMVAEDLARQHLGWTLGVRLDADAQGIFGLQVRLPAMTTHQQAGVILGLLHLRALEVAFDARPGQCIDLNAMSEKFAAQAAAVSATLAAAATISSRPVEVEGTS